MSAESLCFVSMATICKLNLYLFVFTESHRPVQELLLDGVRRLLKKRAESRLVVVVTDVEAE